jgi:hypothetical protein
MTILEQLETSAKGRREMLSAVLSRCLGVSALPAEAGFGRRKASLLGWYCLRLEAEE